ncbi:MAG: ParA family protein [Dehalococcoidia bacterium]
MRKIAVSLSKGGVGKTTTAINLAHGLALAGERVLLVDCDTQGQSAKALGIQSDIGLADLLTEKLKPEETLVEARESLWLLAGGRSLAGAKREVDRRTFGGEMALSEALEPFEGKFDYVILDTAPSLDILSINVLFYGHEVMTPVSPDVLTLHGVIEFQQSIMGVQKYHKGLVVKYIVPTFYDLRVKKSQEIMEQLRIYFPEQLCEPIKYNVRLSEAPGFGQTIFEYDPKSTGAMGYRALTEKVRNDGR